MSLTVSYPFLWSHLSLTAGSHLGRIEGGEKARVALASFVLTPHNLLLLDEPSNHLDITTLDVRKTFTDCNYVSAALYV